MTTFGEHFIFKPQPKTTKVRSFSGLNQQAIHVKSSLLKVSHVLVKIEYEVYDIHPCCVEACFCVSALDKGSVRGGESWMLGSKSHCREGLEGRHQEQGRFPPAEMSLLNHTPAALQF